MPLLAIPGGGVAGGGISGPNTHALVLHRPCPPKGGQGSKGVKDLPSQKVRFLFGPAQAFLVPFWPS